MKRIHTHSNLLLSHKFYDVLYRFWLSLTLSILIMLLEKIPIYAAPIQLIFTTIIVIGCGWPILKQGVYSFFERYFNMFTLSAIAIVITYASGVMKLFFPIIVNHHLNVTFLFEIAAFITTTILLEQIIEIYVWDRLKKAVSPSSKRSTTDIEKQIQLFSHYFILIVLLVAILTFTFISETNYQFISAISVLAIACPRAFTLAAPLAISSGIARGKQFDIMITDWNCLIQLKKMNALIIDKSFLTDPSSSLSLKLLQESGIHNVLVTNDNTDLSNLLDNESGITAIETNVTPQKKNELIKRLNQQKFSVGVVMNTSQATGVTITSDNVNPQGSKINLACHDLFYITRAVQLSKKVMRNIQLSLFFTLIYNLISIFLASGLLYFWIRLVINPIIATGLMLLCIIVVMLNALRLKRIHLIKRPQL